MIRPGTLVWLCIVIAVGYTMFQVKYEVMRQEQTLASLNKQIADDREQIRVLDAEWSYLTRPSRLEDLAARFLHLSGMSAAQIVTLSAVPAAPAAAPVSPSAAAPATGPGLAAVVRKPVP
ncbi:MAG TPA: hypothetical protein VGL83_02770 [Stellaceae bacterium]|jgi:hypothetical protein